MTTSLLLAAPAGIFASHCAMCHGTTAAGSPPAVPSLGGIGKRIAADAFAEVVTHGRNQMPAFTTLGDGQIRALHGYLTTLADTPGKSALAPPGPGTPKPADDLPDPHSLGSGKDSAPRPGRLFSGYNFLLDGNGLPAVSPPWATLSSYDMNSGKLLLRVPYGTHPDAEARGLHDTGAFFSKGSLTATAAGLLFSATADRMLRAWDADTGKVIWQAELPAQPQAIPAIYSVRGRQYVVVAATFSGPGFGSTAGRAPKPYRNAYIAYALPRCRSSSSAPMSAQPRGIELEALGG